MVLLDPRTWLQDNFDLALFCAFEYCHLEREIRDEKMIYVERYCEIYHDDCNQSALEKLEEDQAVNDDLTKELGEISMKEARKMFGEGRIARQCYTYEVK